MDLKSTSSSLPPQSNEVEVILLGRGSSFGEAILLNFGNNNWIAIDSCINPQTQRPLSLDYLDALYGKDNGAKQIKWIIASHWHDDHIRKISELYEASPNANFAIPDIVTDKQVIKLAGSVSDKLGKNSGLYQFHQIMTIAKRRRDEMKEARQLKLLSTDKLIFEDVARNIEVRALSPTDFDKLENIIYLGKKLVELYDKDTKLEKRLVAVNPRNPNDSSVVVLVRIGDNNILLGADLEICGLNVDSGWTAIVNMPLFNDIKAKVFKVPHHGSKTSFHDDIWSKLLHKQPYALITPFANGKVRLPTSDIAQKILVHTEEAYITSNPYKKTETKEKKRRYNIQPGFIRLRKVIDHDPHAWNVDFYGSASKLKDLFASEV